MSVCWKEVAAAARYLANDVRLPHQGPREAMLVLRCPQHGQIVRVFGLAPPLGLPRLGLDVVRRPLAAGGGDLARDRLHEGRVHPARKARVDFRPLG